MPIKKSAMKALRQAKKRTVRNQNVKESLAYLRRMWRKAMEAKELSKAGDLSKQIIKAVDKAIQNKIIKKNTGSRIKSRLMASLNKLSAELRK
jgi:small subunit ribosomal protein S20